VAGELPAAAADPAPLVDVWFAGVPPRSVDDDGVDSIALLEERKGCWREGERKEGEGEGEGEGEIEREREGGREGEGEGEGGRVRE
jgi:hypothetical protein